MLVLGLLPTSTLTAFAATAEHPDAITVSVTDQDGKALAGVTVAYSVSSTANGDDYASGTVTTDANGCVEVLAKDKYVADDLTLSATAALTDYVYADGSGRIEGAAITSDTQDFVIQLRSTKIPGVTVAANSGLVYQKGTAQSLVTVAGINEQTDTVIYKIDGEDVAEPKRENAGTYAVEVTVQRDGYSDFVFSENVTIAKAEITDIVIAEVTAPYNEKDQNIVALTGKFLKDDDVHWYVNGSDTGSAEIPQAIAVGKYAVRLTYSGDANYTFDVDYSDLAKNAAEDYAADHFTIDTVAPRVTGVSYSTSILETVLSNITFGFYNAKMTVTITAEDDTAGVHKFDYSYLTAAGVSSVNAQLLNQAIDEADIKYSNGGKTASMTFEIPKMVLGSDNQFNGTVEFDVIDRSGNIVEQSESKRIVVDNIVPTATVAYNTPVNEENGISYYDGDIHGTITINEANFYADDVSVLVSRDGGAAQALATSWSDSIYVCERGKCW